MIVICNTEEFDNIYSGGHYKVEALGENSYKIDGMWYGRSNFTLVL